MAIQYDSKEFEIQSTAKGITLVKCNSESETVIIPEGVTEIGEGAFEFNRFAKEVVIPGSVKKILRHAFWSCPALTKITIPDSVKTIADHAFFNCYALTRVTISEGVTKIGMGVFGRAWSLEEISVGPRNKNYRSVDNCLIETGTKKLLAVAKNFRIPLDGSVTEIGDFALRSGPDTERITIPEGVTAIGRYAMNTAVKEVILPEGLVSIGENAFYLCAALETISLPKGLKVIAKDLFNMCKSLKSVTLPEGVVSVENGAFHSCEALEEIVLPEGVTEIAQSVFHSCKSLRRVVLPHGITKIGNSAFSECEDLAEIDLPSSLMSMDAYAFNSCKSLKRLHLSKSVTEIGTDAFAGCGGLEEITVEEGNPVYHASQNCLIKTQTRELIRGCRNSVIPSDGSVIKIGMRAFDGCEGLTKIDIPKSVTAVGAVAFQGCADLKEITFSAELYSIGDRAFEGCSSLKELVLPAEIGRKNRWGIGSDAFCGCTALKRIVFPSALCEEFYFIFGISLWKMRQQGIEVELIEERKDPFEISDGVLVRYNGTEKRVQVSSDVKSIGEWAFEGDFDEIDLPESVERVSRNAFGGKAHVKSIVIHGDTVFEKGAFSAAKLPDFNEKDGCIYLGCSEHPYLSLMGVSDPTLEEILLHPECRSISGGAFDNAKEAKRVVISDNVTRVDKGALVFYSKMKKLEIGSGLPMSEDDLSELNRTVRITLSPNNPYLKQVGKNILTADGKTLLFGAAAPVPEGVVTIGRCAFMGARKLGDIQLPEGVETIGKYAFGNTDITSINFPSTLKQVAHNSFYDAEKLVSPIRYRGTRAQWKSIMPEKSILKEVFCEAEPDSFLAKVKFHALTVKLPNNRKNRFNCDFAVQIGDQVRVTGPYAGQVGTVVQVDEGCWTNRSNTNKVTEVIR